mgnify:CR=1 FL=1
MKFKYYEFLMEDFTVGQSYKNCETKEEALELLEMVKGFKSTSIAFVYEISDKGYDKIAEYSSFEFGNLSPMEKLHIKSYMEYKP